MTLYHLVEADPGRTAVPKVSESPDTGKNRLMSWPVTRKPTSPEPTSPGHSLSRHPGPQTPQPIDGTQTSPSSLGSSHPTIPSRRNCSKASHALPTASLCLRPSPCLPEWPREWSSSSPKWSCSWFWGSLSTINSVSWRSSLCVSRLKPDQILTPQNLIPHLIKTQPTSP